MPKSPEQKASSIVDYYKKTIYAGHKGFFSVLFTLLLLIGVLISYSAVQQQQVYKSKAITVLIRPTVSSASCDGEFVTLNVKWNNPRDAIGNIGLSFGASEAQLEYVCDQHKNGGVYLAGTIHCQAPLIRATATTYKYRVSEITKDAGDTRLLAVLRGIHIDVNNLTTPWTAVTVSCLKPPTSSCPYPADQNCSVASSKTFCDACSQKLGGCEWKDNKCVKKGSGATVGGGGSSSTCATTYKGTCQKDSLPCDGGYISGLCPGAANNRCCTLSCVVGSSTFKCPTGLKCDTTKITSPADDIGRCVPTSGGSEVGGGSGSGDSSGGTSGGQESSIGPHSCVFYDQPTCNSKKPACRWFYCEAGAQDDQCAGADKSPIQVCRDDCSGLLKSQCDVSSSCKWFFCGAGSLDDICGSNSKTKEDVCGS